MYVVAFSCVVILIVTLGLVYWKKSPPARTLPLDIGDMFQQLSNQRISISKHAIVERDYKWRKLLRTNTNVIRNEYLAWITGTKSSPILHRYNVGKVASTVDSTQAWKSVILRLFGVDTPFARHFSNTMKLIHRLPVRVLTVMFSILEPGAMLTPHKGVYRGVLRYHLCIEAPRKGTSELRVIDQNGKSRVHTWKSGNDILFDDNYTHEARNTTNEDRIVLFLDIERSLRADEKRYHDLAMASLFHNTEFMSSMRKIHLNYINLHLSTPGPREVS